MHLPYLRDKHQQLRSGGMGCVYNQGGSERWHLSVNRQSSQGRNLALCSFQLLVGNAFSFCKVIPPLP